MSFTPRPWRIKPEYNTADIVGIWALDDQGKDKCIAQVDAVDASLMLAAPDLLVAAQKALVELARIGHEQSAQVCELLQSAIDKAFNP